MAAWESRRGDESITTQARVLRLRRKYYDSGESIATQARVLWLRRVYCDSGECIATQYGPQVRYCGSIAAQVRQCKISTVHRSINHSQHPSREYQESCVAGVFNTCNTVLQIVSCYYNTGYTYTQTSVLKYYHLVFIMSSSSQVPNSRTMGAKSGLLSRHVAIVSSVSLACRDTYGLFGFQQFNWIQNVSNTLINLSWTTPSCSCEFLGQWFG